MAFLDFAKDQYIKTMDTGELIRMGSFKVAKSMEIKYARVTIFIDGQLQANEQIRINVYSDPTTTSLMYSSSWRSLSDITNVSERWLGWLRLDFDRQNWNKNYTYYLAIEAQNYTAILGTYTIGFAYDFPFPIYDNSQSLFYNHPLQCQLFGYNLE